MRLANKTRTAIKLLNDKKKMGLVFDTGPKDRLYRRVSLPPGPLIKEVKDLRPIEALETKEKEHLVQLMLDKKNGVSAIDWRDIVEDYDLNCSPDTLRKAGVGVKLAEDAGMCFPTDGAGTRDVMDGYVERQKLYDLRREIKKDLREQSRSEMLCEMIRDAIRNLPPVEINVPDYKRKNGNDMDLVVGLGDFHFGADFTVNGLYGEELNVYNSEVFARRMEDLIAEVKHIVEVHSPGMITVMIVGDMLDGLLRASQISRLEYGVVESAMRLSEFLSQWLVQLVIETGLPVRVYAVRGNHGEIRPLGSKAGQFPEENMERIVMHYLHERFACSVDVMVDDNDAPMSKIVDVCGFKFLMIHGHGNDIEKIARDHQNLYHNTIDVFMCGHLHKSQTFTAGVLPSGNAVIERVPSLCGIDPYAQSKGYGSQAGATAILVEVGYGMRCVYPITLT